MCFMTLYVSRNSSLVALFEPHRSQFLITFNRLGRQIWQWTAISFLNKKRIKDEISYEHRDYPINAIYRKMFQRSIPAD